MRISYIAFLMFAVAFSSIASAVQAPVSPDDVLTISPGKHPEGEPWAAGSKLDKIDFVDQPFSEILSALSTGYGIKILVPRPVHDRVVTVRLKNVSYQDIISSVLKDTEYEAIYAHPSVAIKKRKPNQALHHNVHVRHGSCCARFEPTMIVDDL